MPAARDAPQREPAPPAATASAAQSAPPSAATAAGTTELRADGGGDSRSSSGPGRPGRCGASPPAPPSVRPAEATRPARPCRTRRPLLGEGGRIGTFNPARPQARSAAARGAHRREGGGRGGIGRSTRRWQMRMARPCGMHGRLTKGGCGVAMRSAAAAAVGASACWARSMRVSRGHGPETHGESLESKRRRDKAQRWA